MTATKKEKDILEEWKSDLSLQRKFKENLINFAAHREAEVAGGIVTYFESLIKSYQGAHDTGQAEAIIAVAQLRPELCRMYLLKIREGLSL